MLTYYLIIGTLKAYRPASRSASVIASTTEGGTEKPSASFSGSGIGSDTGGGDNGSSSPGVGSCVVPFTTLELGPASSGASRPVPLVLSPTDCRVCFGEFDASDARGVKDILREGDVGGPEEDPGGSRSFCLLLPKPPKDVPRF